MNLDDSGDRAGETGQKITDHEKLDRTFRLLSNRRCRFVLEHLRTAANGRASREELADHLLSQDATVDDRDHVHVTLHHRVLPALDDADVVDLDEQTNVVHYHGDALVDALLRRVADRRE